jgi:hypothetical protein
MAIEDGTTAAHVHKHSYSIFAIVAGLLTAVVLCTVLSIVYYQGSSSEVQSTTQTLAR